MPSSALLPSSAVAKHGMEDFHSLLGAAHLQVAHVGHVDQGAAGHRHGHVLLPGHVAVVLAVPPVARHHAQGLLVVVVGAVVAVHEAAPQAGRVEDLLLDGHAAQGAREQLVAAPAGRAHGVVVLLSQGYRQAPEGGIFKDCFSWQLRADF